MAMKGASQPVFLSPSPVAGRMYSSSPVQASIGIERTPSPFPLDARLPAQKVHQAVDLVKQKIQRGLGMVSGGSVNQFAASDYISYNDLVAIVSQTRGTVEAYHLTLRGLKSCVSEISPTIHIDLVKSLINRFPWTTPDESIFATFISLWEDLISCNITHLDPFLNEIISLFVPKMDLKLALKDPEEKKKGPDAYQSSEQKLLFNRVHTILERIMRIVPGVAVTVINLLAQKFPYYRGSKYSVTLYIKNCLILTNYCPILFDKIIGMIFETIIQIDVEIKPEELLDLEPEVNELAEQFSANFVIELQNADVGHKEITKKSHKLDYIMELVFTFFQKKILQIFNDCTHILQTQQNPGSLPLFDQADIMFYCLLKLFDSKVLNSHQLKFSQFLIYYFCNFFDKKFLEFTTEFPVIASLPGKCYSKEYLGYLLNKMIDPVNSMRIRQMCAAYIASFIARSKTLPIDMVKASLEVLLSIAHGYYAEAEKIEGSLEPDAELYGLFYAVTQALFYILCFKFDGAKDSYGIDYIKQLHLETLMLSRLNPFKFCLKTVVKEFVKRFERENIWDGQRIGTEVLKNNKKIFLATKTAFGNDNSIENFFPFDPYMLARSAEFIEEYYVTWQAGPDEIIDESSIADKNESSTEDEDDDSGFAAMAISPMVKSVLAQSLLYKK